MRILAEDRVPENAPGDFYVVRDTCVRCCLPHEKAPQLMNDCDQEFRECYFRHQPQTPQETEQAIQAICVSEVDALRYGGKDQAIIHRLHKLGSGHCCDNPLLGPPIGRHLRNLVLFLLLGAIVNVAVAWGCTPWSALPLSPIWPGFAINTLFYAAILWVLFAVPGKLRRWRRIKRGLCPACAYPIGSSDTCTECGLQLHQID